MKTAKAVKEEVVQWFRDMQYIAGYVNIARNMEGQPDRPEWVNLAETVAINLGQQVKMAVLCRGEHDYVEVYGNPESGSFHMECRRCGHSVGGYW